MPCPGFFRVAKQLGPMTEGTTDLDYWRAEIRRVFLFSWVLTARARCVSKCEQDGPPQRFPRRA
jgi:hypothetical protein